MSANGGVPARHAVVRWAWRMFRREWRQQLLVVALVTVAVAIAVCGATTAYNAVPSADTEFGHADAAIRFDTSDPGTVAANVAAARQAFGAVEVVGHTSAPIPGSNQVLDVRAQAPAGVYSAPTLALRAGRYPHDSGEVALTRSAAATFDAAVGDTVRLDHARTVVGLVENPEDLSDEFAVVAPGSLRTGSTALLVRSSRDEFQAFHDAANGSFGIESRNQFAQRAAAQLALAAATIVLLLVSLVAAAGFAAVAQRRLRQLGMLDAIGATEEHLRLVVVANGVVVGAISAVAGVVMGVGAWLAIAPRLESPVGHRIDRFDVPWWLVAVGAVLAVSTATAAAWWPARSMARVPVVSALSGRPPRPRPAHRSALVALALLVGGAGLIVYGGSTRALPIMAGIVAIGIGLLFVSPVAVRALGSLGGRLPVAARVALRDLARNQARSGAALAAISLGLAIPVTIVIAASAAQYSAMQGNLAANQLHFRVGDDATLPVTDAVAQRMMGASVDAFAATLDRAIVVPLEQVVSSADHATYQGRDAKPVVALARPVGANTYSDVGPLYVATPALMSFLGITPQSIGPNVDVLTSATGAVDFVNLADRRPITPNTQHIAAGYSSLPVALLTTGALERRGWQAAPAGWIVQSKTSLTSEQRAAARKVAATAGITVEARNQQARLTTMRAAATAAGLLLALGILAMTVGLLRAEAAGELRTLTAAGATGAIRRAITATTAGALALLGALLGTGVAYLGFAAGYVHDLSHLHRVPGVELAVIGLGLPVFAALAGWILAGREPAVIARAALD